MKSILVTTLLLTGIASAEAVNTPAIIPAPQKLERREGVFELTARTTIYVDSSSGPSGQYLAERMRRSTGFAVAVADAKDSVPAGGIWLTTNGAAEDLGPEGYTLAVSPDKVVIGAPAEAGLFYGVETLLQLLPVEIFSSRPATNVAWQIPAVQVEDRPRFKWRGMMLDVSRHFFSKQEVERLLDVMALHKLNTFHWHLVDDTGWRIEIKKYPKLTQLGAWRSGVDFGLDPQSTDAYGPDGRYGGYYTQEDIREVVAYAQARHITVVPEIEMPGHSVAALSVIPQLSCSGDSYSTDIGAGVHSGVYCAGNDQCFDFIQDVLTEVFELFPSKYIHIGGDEVPKDNWKKCAKCQERIKKEGLKNEDELQSYFIRRIEKFVNSRGRTVLGWSEILQGGLAQNAAVMDWIGGGLEAARSGHDVVMSPTAFCYFDYCQSMDRNREPQAIGGYVPLRKVYSFEPVPAALAEKDQPHVLGAQANLWTEYIASVQHLEYMIFPRLCAMSEVVWSPKESRNWEDFQQRLKRHEPRLQQLRVAYRHDNSVVIGAWSPSDFAAPDAALQWDVSSQLKAGGEYRVTLDYTQGDHGIDISSVALLADGREVASDSHHGFTGASPWNSIYVLTVPEPKPGVRYTLKAAVKGSGGTNSYGTVSWVKASSR